MKMKLLVNQIPRVSFTFGVLAMIAAGLQFAYAEPIPQARRIDWSSAGVPGGIPNRTNICSTLSPGASASSINSALDSCSNGVVKLNPGTYSVTGIQVFNNNVTLR